MYLPPYIRDIHGTVFSPSPIERELFYRDDLHIWYIYDGTAWVSLLTGMIIHGNAWHAPAFATEAAFLAHVATTGAGIHGSSVAAAINTLVHRDGAGRAKIVDPAVAADIDNLGARNAAIAAIVLDDLFDVVDTAAIEGDMLYFDQLSGTWMVVGAANLANILAGLTILSDLADVAVVAPADDDILCYDILTGEWGPRQLVDADIPAAIARDAEVAAAIAVHALLANAHHAEDHHARHEPGGGDPMAVDAVPATGSLRTLGAGAQQAMPGDFAPPAGPHAPSHEPGGGDAMAVDQAAGTGSLRTLGGGAVQAAAGNHTHTLNDDTSGSAVGGTATGSSGTYYRYTQYLSSLQTATIATTTPNFQAGSLAFGVGSFHGRGGPEVVLQLIMGGVQVAQSGGLSAAEDRVLVVKGFRALSGSQACYIRLKNTHTSLQRYFNNFAYVANVRKAGAIGVGSVKI